MAVVALGSYARRELCPRSDIDLLLLHDGWRRGDLKRLVRSLCYPLWDAGLSVGHAVHTPRQAAAAMEQGLNSATALSDRRLVAGDPGLADELTGRTARWLRRHGGRLLAEVAAAGAARHARDGAHPGMLEPDLKSGPGGLRDLHSLQWAAVCVLGEPGLDVLVGARYLSATERRQLAAASDTLLAARCALHHSQGRAVGDVLRLEVQDDVAARIGLDGGDALLHEIGIAMRAVAHVHGRAFHALLADATRGRRRKREPPTTVADGVTLVDGLVEVDDARALGDDSGLALRAVAVAATRGVHLGRRTSDLLARHVRNAGPLAWHPAMVDDLVAALAAGEDGLPALRDADHAGLLSALLPDWPRVRGRRQRNPYHRYDLDTHLLLTAAWLRTVATGGVAPRHRSLWAGLADQQALILAAFLHDVGKAWPGDHSAVGSGVAERWLAHMGVQEARRRRVAHLVAHHLLLPDTATRRDIDDEAEVVAVAERAGSVEALDGLYLLSLADGRATGPGACSTWKEDLVATLHSRARRVLAEDAVGEAVLDPAAVAAAVRASTPAGPDRAAAVERLLAHVPRRYLLAATPDQCLAHARLLATLGATDRPAVDVRPGPTADTSVLSVAAPDRLGLVADCAGALAAAGTSVLEARAFTLPARDAAPPVALDWFVVETTAEGLPPTLAAQVVAAAAGQVDVAAALTARERRRGRRTPGAADIDVRIEHDADVGRIEVHAPDTPGLLSRLTHALSAADVDVTGARVLSMGGTVRDVFFVRWTADLDPHALERLLRAAAVRSEHAREGE